MSNLFKLIRANLDALTIGLLISCAAVYAVTHTSTCSYENSDC